MNSTSLLNYLIQQQNGRRYLEISVHGEEENFSGIHCNRKVKINAKVPAYTSTHDSFVETSEKFDIIFIDGLHLEEQVIEDVRFAFRCLAAGGIIVLHDCMPSTAWHQREQADVRDGEAWNGTVWKAALRIFNQTKYTCDLIDTDWGFAIIDTGRTQIPKCRPLPEFLRYELHYPWLLDYKISLATYLRRSVKVFYHLACMGNWQYVFTEQMRQLKQNGFEQLSLAILGEEEDVYIVEKISEELKLVNHIIFRYPLLTYFETPALLAIEDYALLNGGYVLYLHSKGVSNPADDIKMKWRRLMMHELVEKWENCVIQLPYYDAIGVNWREMPPRSHFCGNFWYASTSYLRTLLDFSSYYNSPPHLHDGIWDKRLGCEFWISSGKVAPRILSLFCTNVDFCNHNFWNIQEG